MLYVAVPEFALQHVCTTIQNSFLPKTGYFLPACTQHDSTYQHSMLYVLHMYW